MLPSAPKALSKIKAIIESIAMILDMKGMLARSINKVFHPIGIKISRIQNPYPVEASSREIEIIDYILRLDNPKEALSMVSIERIWSIIQATKYIIKNNIEGDFVECGVWRGGCSLAMAMILDDLKANRKIFLYDTFSGMTSPTSLDIDMHGNSAKDRLGRSKKDGTNNVWAYASIEDVKAQFKYLGLEQNTVFVKGDVLKTLDKKNDLPKQISLLRLDTDWYQSTKHELNILYPKLERGGVLLIDDYGDWKGSKKAVDEYFEEKDLRGRSLFWRIDHTGRGLIKN